MSVTNRPRPDFDKVLLSVIIGKKSKKDPKVFDFLIFTEKRGFPFFPWGRLRKLSHFPSGTGPRTKLTPKIVFVIPDPMRLCKTF
jgi:hypothetical protein